ncbi:MULTISPECIES: hypothetical protein [Acinetobacter]|uniref:hypothetical protein n=1 Tax=Acinetobacter TaxID=469 RepID=UPI0013647218|nr:MULTISPECIES: hypothetical protein [Acinetobacter]MDM1287212.1 hypothetical protein [Acinetobacter indicus]
MKYLTESLKKVEQDLAYFVSPENKDGFIKEFASWVYGEWSKNDFYETDIVDLGYDCSSHPEKTNQSLSDKCPTYAEFINANTGVSVCTHISGHGMGCEEYSEKLGEIFGDACAKKLDELAEQYKLEVPEKYKKYGDNIREMIFGEWVDHREDFELYEVCDSILVKYGYLGDESEQYSCPICAVDHNGEYIYQDKIFKNYTLEDFKKLTEIK